VSNLNEQIEKAFNHRGHVTLTFKSGDTLEGYLFNREFENPNNPENNYIDFIPKNSEEQKRFQISELEKIDITGKDHAESYEDTIKRTGGRS
jgi:hypothetical protein